MKLLVIILVFLVVVLGITVFSLLKQNASNNDANEYLKGYSESLEKTLAGAKIIRVDYTMPEIEKAKYSNEARERVCLSRLAMLIGHKMLKEYDAEEKNGTFSFEIKVL